MVTAARRWELWSTEACVVVTEPSMLDPAVDLSKDVCLEVEMACSRFRDDSELMLLRGQLGDGREISDVLAAIVRGALAAAEMTDGDVDPTLGNVLLGLGYDRDFSLLGVPRSLGPESRGAVAVAPVAPGWTRIVLAGNRLRVPTGLLLDFGAIGKALAADWAADRIASRLGCGSMVSLGGDLATAGEAPPEGWVVLVQDLPGDPSVCVGLSSGYALATSSTQKRLWNHSGREVHHIIDPHTGLPAEAVWRTVTVAAKSCADANTIATACVVRGRRAPSWLRELGVPARLVDSAGRVSTFGSWPPDELADQS
ncbi:FAD:protein FMN transferase [Arthrobacter sp. B2a2-09]|uniref:FAD:protein FMN transferase n=1 Tax=Arthrobacter sp. B2a2-09 TaxID=2952822 RepID=UPI0022CD99EE|nr:FAD:protein FMN transferase [Arthrobacter sp. B2a2-09]MCZ9880368.1 FAD:protein FMN transferase [Arthrobacter sp. B2a2-09]